MKAWEIIQKHGWCQHSSAKDRHGDPVGWDDPRAASFCILGALAKAYNGSTMSPVEMKLRYVLNECVVAWNDVPGREEEDVINVLKFAEGPEPSITYDEQFKCNTKKPFSPLSQIPLSPIPGQDGVESVEDCEAVSCGS